MLQLYKSLHPEDKTATEDDLEDVTINPVFMGSEYNDLGFSVGDRLITLVESQSTWSINIVIRAFMYLADTYQQFFERTKQSLYGTKRVKMPIPELYVIYTGNKKKVPESISLKEDFFGDENCAVDVTVKILSNKDDKNIIGEYIAFCKVYDEQFKICGRTKKAVQETIRICKDKSILKEYLKERESEIINIMMSLFSEESLSRAYDAELERKYETKLKLVENEYAERAKKAEQETVQRVERETAEKEARQFAVRLLKLDDMPAEK